MSAFAQVFSRIDDVLRRIEAIVSVLCLAAIVLATGLGVFFRYVLNDPLVWSNGAGVLAMMWLTFIGGSYLFKSDGHINISAVPALLGPLSTLVLQTVFSAVIFLTALLIAWQMLTLVPLQHKKEIDVLSLPRSAYGVPLMWAMASIAISSLTRITRCFAGLPPVSVGKTELGL